MIDKREVLETASALGLLPIQEPAWPNLLSGQGRLPLAHAPPDVAAAPFDDWPAPRII